MANDIGTTGLVAHKDTFNGIYRGVVLDNNDPSQYGRIKVKVYPMLDGITDTTLLPWAIPAYPIWEGAGSNIGYFAVPKVNSYVYVFFEQGSIYQPVYFAEAPTATLGLPSARTTSYPNRKVSRTTSGIEVIVDDTTGLVRINHPTGTFVEIQADGNIQLDPKSTKRTIINAFARTVESKNGGTLNGDDGGLITFSGPVTFVLPSAADYPGLEYVFKRMDGGLTPATVATNIEPNPYLYREITGLYATLHLISGGSVTGLWHVI